MNWVSIGLAAAAGAIAALVTSGIVRKPQERRVAYAVVFVLAFAGLNALGKEHILPIIEAEMLERQLAAIPIYQAIKKHDFATYNEVMAALKQGLKAGKTETEILGVVKPRMEQLIVNKVPLASDQAVVNYIRVMVQSMREYRKHGGDLCYKFLFPQQYGYLNAQKYLPQDIIDADFASAAEVIKTASERPQMIPKEGEVQADMDATIDFLVQKHGDKIAVLQDLPGSADKNAGCDIAADLYDQILTLPVDRSGRLLRFMMSTA